VTAAPSLPRAGAELPEAKLRETNRRFYDALWTDARLVAPERFNTWPVARALAARSPRRLEVAPGLRPRLPLVGTVFVDASAPAVSRLRASGATALRGLAAALPLPDDSFDLVCALDVVEHLDDDDGALAELARVAAADASLLVSVPLHASLWNAFDEFVGHRRRYEPSDFVEKLSAHGFAVEQSGIFGMQPRSSLLLSTAMWSLTHRRERAMWWYNRVMMPLGVRFQKKLTLAQGMIDTENVDEIFLVCRKVRFSQLG
jgi:SAM-dependent methyltransferase